MSNLEELTIGKGLKTLDYYFFCSNCPNLKRINWNATCLDEKIFDVYHMDTDHCYANIETIVFGDNVETIPGQLFSQTPVTNVTLGSNVKRIGEGAFFRCSNLRHINLPEGLEIIGEYGFRETGISEVFIPTSVTRLESWCFFRCNNLTKVIATPSIAPENTSAFLSCEGINFYVPDLEAYKSWDTDIRNDYMQMATSEINSYEYNNGEPIDFAFRCNLPDYAITSYSCDDADAYSLGEHNTKIEMRFDGPRPFVTSFHYKYTVTKDSGLDEISEIGTHVYTTPQAIVVESDKSAYITIYTMAGACLYKGSTGIIEAPSGIYVVSVDGKPYKVIVK